MAKEETSTEITIEHVKKVRAADIELMEKCGKISSVELKLSKEDEDILDEVWNTVVTQEK